MQAESVRLEKEINRLGQELGRISGKLNNPKFVDKAPQKIVDKERSRLEELQSTQGRFQQQLKTL